MSRTEQLKKIMWQHYLTAAAVGAELNRSPSTVRAWRCVNDKRTIPEHALQLLLAKYPLEVE